MTIESRALVSDAFVKIDQSGTPHTPLPRFDNRQDLGEDFVDLGLSGDKEGSGDSPSTIVVRRLLYAPMPDDTEESRTTFLIVPLPERSNWKNKYEVPVEWSTVGMFTANLVPSLGWEYHTLEELARSQNVWLTADVPDFFGIWLNKENDEFRTAEIQKQLVEDQERERLANRLWTAFVADPLEDGMSHPAEEIIGEALRSTKDKPVLDWFMAFSLDVVRPSFAASVLRCLGRQTPPGTDLWRTELVRDGLAMDDVEIRDAAVQAAESWGDRSLVDVMRAHREAEPWLREYIEDVISDLGE